MCYKPLPMTPFNDANGAPAAGAIFSMLDTDLYKLTMQCAVLKYFPDVQVAYKFTNRTPHMQLTRRAYNWLQEQVQELADVAITEEELAWLTKKCPYLSQEYLTFLKSFRFRPDKHIEITFVPKIDDGGDDVSGEVDIATKGLWLDTILFEIPLLALVSEAYFKFVDKDWDHDSQRENAKQKGIDLLSNGCVISEFGSRRRRDYKTHALIVQGLVDAQKDADTNGKDWKGKLTGTSNVHMAMKFGVNPIGTVAHEWFMAIAAITDNYAGANEAAMQYWIGTFGRGVLGHRIDRHVRHARILPRVRQTRSEERDRGDGDARPGPDVCASLHRRAPGLRRPPRIPQARRKILPRPGHH